MILDDREFVEVDTFDCFNPQTHFIFLFGNFS